MARIVGRRAGLWVLTLLGLVVLAPLAVFFPLVGAFALALAGGAAALLSLGRARALEERCDKLSGEVDVMAQRLIRLEAVVRVVADRQVQTELARIEPPDAARVQPDPQPRAAESASLAAEVEEVTAEIGLLSGIVRELAGVVAAQDGELARLKAAPPPAPGALPASPSGAAPIPARPGAPAAVGQEIVHGIGQGIGQEIVVPPRRAVPDSAAARSPVSEPVAPRMPRPLDRAGLDDTHPADDARTAALVVAFDGEGLEIHLQPVVSLPQRKVVSYEAVARLRVEGEILSPDLFLPMLERQGRTTDLDRRMLQRVATVARHLGARGSQAVVAYGLSPLSLFEPGFLRSLARLVAGEPDLSGRLMLALPQSSWRSLDAEQAGALTDLRGRIGFTLDRPMDLRLDPLALADRGISQVKVPADMLLRPASRLAMPDIAVEDLVAALARAGIRLVADRVEREGDVPDLIDLDVPLAQGSVFAPARAVRPEILGAPPPAPAAPAPAPETEEPEAPPQRRPFRDFLRRAG